MKNTDKFTFWQVTKSFSWWSNRTKIQIIVTRFNNSISSHFCAGVYFYHFCYNFEVINILIQSFYGIHGTTFFLLNQIDSIVQISKNCIDFPNIVLDHTLFYIWTKFQKISKYMAN